MLKDTASDVQYSALTQRQVRGKLMLYLAFGSAERLERALIGL